MSVDSLNLAIDPAAVKPTEAPARHCAFCRKRAAPLFECVGGVVACPRHTSMALAPATAPAVLRAGWPEPKPRGAR